MTVNASYQIPKSLFYSICDYRGHQQKLQHISGVLLILYSNLFMLQVLEFLADPNNDTRHSEREQALLELLNAGGLQQVDNEKLLRLAEDAKL